MEKFEIERDNDTVLPSIGQEKSDYAPMTDLVDIAGMIGQAINWKKKFA